MATYQVTGPDGHKYRVTGPDGATDEQVLGQIEAYSKQAAPTGEPRTGADAIPGTQPQAAPAPEEGWLDKAKGVGEAGLSVLSSIPAMAKAGLQSLPGTGVRPPGRFGERVAADTYAPRTETGRDILQGLGKAGESMQALGPEVGGYGSLFKGMGEATTLARPALGAVPSVGGAVGKLAAPVVDRAKGMISTLKGDQAAQATSEALSATKGALAQESSSLGHTVAAKSQEAANADSVAIAVQRNLDQMAERGGRPTLDVQGENVRTAVSGAYDAAKEARSKATAGLYDDAAKAAAAREKDGARIDVSTVTPDVQKLLDKADNIPDLKAKLGKLINAVTGTEEKVPVAAPLGKGKVSARVTQPKMPSEAKPGLTYQELDLANKYLKDIAYSGELQGYDSIVRRAAMDLSHKLDTQIAKFVPEHAAASAKYAQMSEPLESMATRIGRAITGGEGGLKGEAYAKVPSQNLPARLFGTKDGINLVVDAIAGGKAGPARASAQKQVDQMVEHWIMDSARGSTGATGAAAAKTLQAPQMAATLRAVPSVGKKLAGQFANEERIAGMGERASQTAKTAGTEAKAAAGAKARVDKAMAQAEVDYVHGSKQKAYESYVAALRQSMADVDPAKYKAAIGLIERAGTLQGKTDKARSLAKKFIWGAGGVAAGMEIKGLLQ